MILKDFLEWVNQAQIGDRTVYFTGDLAYERYRQEMLASLADDVEKKKYRLLPNFADIVYNHLTAGIVHLVQKRVGVGEFEYIAIKAQPRKVQFSADSKMFTSGQVYKSNKAGIF